MHLRPRRGGPLRLRVHPPREASSQLTFASAAVVKPRSDERCRGAHQQCPTNPAILATGWCTQNLRRFLSRFFNLWLGELDLASAQLA